MPDTEPILTLLNALIQSGEVLELRYIQHYPNTTRVNHPANGYFNDPSKLLAEAQRFAHYMQQNNQAYEPQVTLNPVRRDLLYTTRNTLRRPACWLTQGSDVTRRAVLLVQFKGKYPAAKERAYKCRDWLMAQDYPAPVIAYNGDSIDVILPVNLPNTPDSTLLIQQVLAALDRRFSDAEVQVDANLHAPALLVPLYGIAPHTRILYLPETLTLVDAPQLQRLVALPAIDPRDLLKQFVTEQCVLDKRAWTPTGKLHQAYQALGDRYGLQPLSAPHFTRALTARFGLEAVRHKVYGVVTRGIQGIRLKRAGA